MSAKAPAKGHTAKHATAPKAATTKHAPAKTKHKQSAATRAKESAAIKKAYAAKKAAAKVHVAAKPAKPAKPAGFAIGDLLPVCASEAVAMSLRLAGGAVSDEDVLRLHVLAAGSETAPASILAVLEAASAFGLAGCTPTFQAAPQGVRHASRVRAGHHSRDEGGRHGPCEVHGLILGVNYPGYHAVLATPDGWWSWGVLYSPWNARAEEAWGVSWG